MGGLEREEELSPPLRAARSEVGPRHLRAPRARPSRKAPRGGARTRSGRAMRRGSARASRTTAAPPRMPYGGSSHMRCRTRARRGGAGRARRTSSRPPHSLHWARRTTPIAAPRCASSVGASYSNDVTTATVPCSSTVLLSARCSSLGASSTSPTRSPQHLVSIRSSPIRGSWRRAARHGAREPEPSTPTDPRRERSPASGRAPRARRGHTRISRSEPEVPSVARRRCPLFVVSLLLP